MNENRKNWLYPDASGLYFLHDGFIMRAFDGKQYDIDEECELLNAYHKGYNECRDDVLRLEKENEQLKQSYKEFEDECQSTFNAMNRKQNDLYRKNFKLKEENEQLKQQKDKWKQQCIDFKEMLDDMDIAYLCDEWIYEELEGDLNDRE